MTKQAQQERAEAIAQLKEWLKPGDTVYTILHHVSRSGMMRHVRLVAKLGDGFIHPSYSVAKAMGMPLIRGGMSDAIKVGGCGFDAGHHVVYHLSAVLWPDGFGCIGKRCRSNDHSNGDRDRTPHNTCSNCGSACEDGCNAGCQNLPGLRVLTHWHRDGGYALRQEWL
jgi:hypothetical protein